MKKIKQKRQYGWGSGMETRRPGKALKRWLLGRDLYDKKQPDMQSFSANLFLYPTPASHPHVWYVLDLIITVSADFQNILLLSISFFATNEKEHSIKIINHIIKWTMTSKSEDRTGIPKATNTRKIWKWLWGTRLQQKSNCSLLHWKALLGSTVGWGICKKKESVKRADTGTSERKLTGHFNEIMFSQTLSETRQLCKLTTLKTWKISVKGPPETSYACKSRIHKRNKLAN